MKNMISKNTVSGDNTGLGGNTVIDTVNTIDTTINRWTVLVTIQKFLHIKGIMY